MSNVTDTFYASNAIVGYGGQFKVGQGDSPETFVAVPEVNSITVVKGSTATTDVTHLRSLNRHREKRGTLRDSGPIQVKFNYRPDHGAHMEAGGDGFDTDHNLVSLWKNVTANNFEIELLLADGVTTKTLPVVGTITAYEVSDVVVDGKLEGMLEITPLHDYFTN